MSVQPMKEGGLSFRSAALTAGLGLLFMTLCAPPAYFHFLPQAVVEGDAVATLEALRGEAGSPYVIGAFLLFITYCLDVVVLWGLYWLFRAEQPAGAQFVAWSRLLYTALAFAGLMFYFQAFDLAASNKLAVAVDAPALGNEVMSKIVSADSITALALFFFGFHLVALSVVVWLSDRVPSWLAVVLALAGLGYIVPYLLSYIAPDFSVDWMTLLGLGELVFMFWLFFAAWRSPDIA